MPLKKEEKISDQLPVIVITGGAGGMGLACARRLQNEGVLLLTDVAEKSLNKAVQQLEEDGISVEALVSDITDPDSVQQLVNRVHELGYLRGIVHTAGISPTMGKWELIIQVDLVGTINILQAFLPLAQEDTAIVCIASMAGHVNNRLITTILSAFHRILDRTLPENIPSRFKPLMRLFPSKEMRAGIAYLIAKYAVIRLCKHQAREWGKRGARIVSLSPGIIQTPMGIQEFEKQPVMTKMVDESPLKRMGQPDEIATAVEFLLSSKASYITGCDLLVDGGVTGSNSK